MRICCGRIIFFELIIIEICKKEGDLFYIFYISIFICPEKRVNEVMKKYPLGPDHNHLLVQSLVYY
jgi:hypothetical protein